MGSSPAASALDKSLATYGQWVASCRVASFRLILMAFFALRLLGGDLAVLQVVAWSGMIVARTTEQGVAAAVESTFDGEHPCPLCKALKTAQETEDKQPALPEGFPARLKLKDLVLTEDLALARPFQEPMTALTLPPWRMAGIVTRSEVPLVPPPRQATA